MYLTSKEVNNWLHLYPIKASKGRYKIKVYELDKLLEWINPNRLPNLGRISFNELAERIASKGIVGYDGHYVETLVQTWCPIAYTLTILGDPKNKIVWDGSHRLTSIALAKRKGIKIPLSHVGVVYKF